MIIAAGHLETPGQMAFYRQITAKPLAKPEEKDIDSRITGKSTLRGQKYKFVLDIMKRCNSTDMAKVMLFCKQSTNRTIRETWEHIFTNTQNIQLIMQAAASDLQIQTKVTPIYEQIRQKKDLFTLDGNRYWSVQKSLNIYDAWAEYHNFDTVEFGRNLFEVCHMIRAKKNGFHITGPSNSGKSYVLRSVRNGLMNCGRMRCQASDNFTFGSCVDKTLIYTDEMWFTP